MFFEKCLILRGDSKSPKGTQMIQRELPFKTEFDRHFSIMLKDVQCQFLIQKQSVVINNKNAGEIFSEGISNSPKGSPILRKVLCSKMQNISEFMNIYIYIYIYIY